MAKGDNSPTGTKETKYSGPENGPFRCDRCIHFVMAQGKELCDHPKVVADPEMKQETVKNRTYAAVSSGGCCEYFRKIPLVDVPFIKLGI